MDDSDRFLGIVDEPKRKQTWIKRLKSLVCFDRKGLKKPPSLISPVLIERSVVEEDDVDDAPKTPSTIEWKPVKDPRMPPTPPLTPPSSVKKRSEPMDGPQTTSGGDWNAPFCGICLG